MPAGAAAPSGRTWRRLGRVPLLLLGSGFGVLLVAWLTFHWAILPHIPQWRVSIEEQASRALGMPVRIGRIEGRSSGWMPSFELQDVALLGPDGRTVLRLPHVFAAMSSRSLLTFRLDFAQLLIDTPELEVRRDPTGRVFVAGIDVGRLGAPDRTAESAEPAVADWFFRQQEVVVRGGVLRWTDDERGAPPIAFAQVELVVRNGPREHALRLAATPPAAWGDRMSVVGRFVQPLLAAPADWRRWSGSVYADLPRIDVGAAQRHLSWPSGIRRGVGAVRAWFDVSRGAATAATIDVAARDVDLQLSADARPMALTLATGRVIGRRDRDGAEVEARQLHLQTVDGLDWRSGASRLAWRQREGQPVTGGSLSADRLDLGLLARLAERLPLGDATRQVLADWRPQGIAQAVEARWDGPPAALSHYRIQGRLTGLALAAKPSSRPGGIGRPGVRNADVQVDVSESGGTARVALIAGAIELPGVFEEPLVPLDRLSGELGWKVEPAPPGASAGADKGLSVEFKNVRIANSDAQGRVAGRWSNVDARGQRAVRLSGGGVASSDLGQLELDGELVDGRAERLYRYLPLALPLAARDYLHRAVQGGRLTRLGVHIRGELRKFPFFKPGAGKAAQDGEFRLVARADDLSLAYVPGRDGAASVWPMLTGASAELALERGAFSFRHGHGRIGEIEWDGIDGTIEHLGGEDAVLTVDLAARGPLAGMLRFVEASPVGGWLGGSLAKASARGQARLGVTLGLPLRHLEAASTVAGHLVLAGDDEVRFTADSPLLRRARGRLDFTRSGFRLAGVGADVYGGEASIEGGTDPADGRIRFLAHGQVGAEGLQQATELGPVARFATVLSGKTAYRLNLAFLHGRPELLVDSDLVGMAIELPAPLAKPADQPLAMHYRSRTEGAPGSEPPRESFGFELGDRLGVRYLRESTGEAPRILSGGIGVFAPAPEPASGVAAHIRLDSLDADAWVPVFDRLFSAVAIDVDAATVSRAASVATADGPPAGPSSAASPAGDAPGTVSGYQPSSIALEVRDLRTGARRLTHLTASLSQPPAGGVWRANVDADQLAGEVEYRPPARAASTGAAGGAGRLYARLSRLSLPRSDARQGASVVDEPPTTLPALDVVVDDLELNGLRLGRMEVQASNRPVGGPPLRQQAGDWRLTKFAVTTPEAQLVASGHWAAAPAASPSAPPAGTAAGPRRMVLDFRLQVADSGALLDRLGSRNAIRGGKGELAGQLAWLGSPFALDYPSLSGQVQVQIDQGQFLKAEPGAARLLGVLSLQALPRRLTLDFRDVFERGFAFDAITGDLTIAGGVARTRNLHMRGVQAAVRVEGSADIERETEDLRVVVVPEINAGTAALAYAVINPALGLGAFVAQALLKNPLTAAGTREFQVLGPWSDPKVLPVARQSKGDSWPDSAGRLAAPVDPAAIGAPQNP